MALKYLPGESPSICLYDLIDPGAGPMSSGVTVTLRLIDAADAQAVAPVTASLSGTSDWCATLTMPQALGSYRLEAAITPDGGDTRYQHEDVTVGPRYDVGAWSLRDLRRRVGRALGDLRTCRATAATAAGTFTAANDLLLPNNAYMGRYAHGAVCAAANRGKSRFVIASAQTTATITFGNAFPAAFAVGDQLDLTNERGIGWLPEDYHDAINTAIRDAGDMGGVPLGATITSAFDGDAGRAALPSAFGWVHAVEYRTATDAAWLPVARAADVRGPGWFVADRYLELGATHAALADGGSVRVLGAGTPDTLEDEDDRTLVNAEWVEAYALKRLLLAGRRMDPERERLFGWADRESTRLKAQAVPLLDGEAVEVR